MTMGQERLAIVLFSYKKRENCSFGNYPRTGYELSDSKVPYKVKLGFLFWPGNRHNIGP